MIGDVILSIGGYDLKHIMGDICDWELLVRDPSDFLLVDLEAICGTLTAYNMMSRLTSTTTTSCIACTFSRTMDSMRMAFECGAMGYILKDSEYGDFRMNLELALCGGVPMSAGVARLLISSLNEREIKAGRSNAYVSPFVARVEEAVDDYLADPCETGRGNLSDYLSLRMHMSYGHISVLYRQQTGVRLSRLRQERRIELAKGMLKSTELTLTDIAGQLEFSSVAHLSASFRRITGITPTEYRHASFRNAMRDRKDATGYSRA